MTPGPNDWFQPVDVKGDEISLSVRWSQRLVFGGILVLALTLRLACITGLIGSDDVRYATYARAAMEGRYAQTLDESRRTERIHQGLRSGVILPVAGVYKVLGVSEWSTIALPLLASTLSVLLLAAIAGRLFDVRVAIIAALLYATFPMQLRLATMLLPEPIAECLILLAILLYLCARDRGGTLWVAAGALIGVAYLAKEVSVFAGGALFLHAIWERRWRGAVLVTMGLAAVIAGEHTYYYLTQGDFLFRTHYTALPSPDAALSPRVDRHLFYRLLSDYPKMMLVPGTAFGLHSIACLIWAGAALVLWPRRGFVLILLWAAIPWLYLNFGSWSLETYALLPREPRYIAFTYPPLMLLSGVTLSRALSRRGPTATLMAAGLGAVMVIGVISGLATRGEAGRGEEMTVLREIVRVAQRAPGQTIYSDNSRWRNALQVFDASLVSDSQATAAFVVVPDALGLPAAQRAASMPCVAVPQ